MNIQNIQIAQGLLRAVEGKLNSSKGNISAESDISRQEINLPETEEKVILSDNSKLSKGQGDELELFYPPFFPLGNTQGIYSVMIQAKTDSSSADLTEKQKANNTTNTETTAARQQVAKDEDEIIKNNVPETKETVNPGNVLDFKV